MSFTQSEHMMGEGFTDCSGQNPFCIGISNLGHPFFSHVDVTCSAVQMVL